MSAVTAEVSTVAALVSAATNVYEPYMIEVTVAVVSDVSTIRLVPV